MNIPRILRKLRANFDILRGEAKFSYSQYGEDLLVDAFFSQYMGITHPSYLDIGTNSPTGGNNTYLFYLKKCKGVCVEPDISLYEKILSSRPNDTVLNMGVGINGLKEGRLYYFPDPYTGWNTFSKEDAMLKQQQTGVSFKDDRMIAFIDINQLIGKYFDTCPDFVSIDVEGLDYDILSSLDFNKYRPKVFCVETMEFNNLKLGRKNTKVMELLTSKGYEVYADTYINTIFVSKELLNL